MTTATTPYRCNFCGKDRTEVENLICASDGTAICDECVALFVEILQDVSRQKAEQQFDEIGFGEYRR